MITTGEMASIAITIITTVFGAYVAIRVAIKGLEKDVVHIKKDLDGIAAFIGTPTALARLKTKEETNA